MVDSLAGLRAELLRLRRGMVEVAAAESIGIAAAGTAPSSAFADFELTTTGRYGRMQEQYRLLVDEQLICGLQIHVGVSDRDLAVQIMQRVAARPADPARPVGQLAVLERAGHRLRQHPLDHLAALADAPARPGGCDRPREYDELLTDLINTGVIADAKMAYFDVRPSAHAPTLELRTCDACPIVDDAIADRRPVPGDRCGPPSRTSPTAGPSIRCPPPVHRAAIWQAARGGLTGVLLDDTRHPKPLPARRAVKSLL